MIESNDKNDNDKNYVDLNRYRTLPWSLSVMFKAFKYVAVISFVVFVVAVTCFNVSWSEHNVLYALILLSVNPVAFLFDGLSKMYDTDGLKEDVDKTFNCNSSYLSVCELANKGKKIVVPLNFHDDKYRLVKEKNKIYLAKKGKIFDGLVYVNEYEGEA